MTQAEVYLTSQGRKELEEELDQLINIKRPEVAVRLHEAMEDGELIENAEYEAAKNEQAFVEGRILELEDMLSRAKTIRKRKGGEVVRIGSQVIVRENGSRSKSEKYRIVGAAEANPKEGLISNESPLGQSLLDKKVGDKIEVQAPAGVIQFKIESIE